jgi:hypothetical protein
MVDHMQRSVFWLDDFEIPSEGIEVKGIHDHFHYSKVHQTLSFKPRSHSVLEYELESQYWYLPRSNISVFRAHK